MTLFNADDYGVTAAQTEHILDCRKHGCLTGVSAMPNSPYLPEAMSAIADDPGLRVAVHLNLTEGLCLSDPADIPLLAQADGRFYPSFLRLFLLSLGPKRAALLAEMQRELTAQIEPAYSFRSDFRYNTMFYSISALLVEKLTGRSWEENLRSRILVPLGMTETSTGGNGLMLAENKAQSHTAQMELGRINVEPIPYEHQPMHRLTEISAAGGIVSNVTDMARWLMFQMGDGTVGGRRLVSKKQMDEIHKGVSIAKQSEDAITLYGYGWYVEQSVKGKLYWHTGSGYGHTAICGWLPELKLGFMVSCNTDGGAGFRRAVMRRIIDLYLGYPDTDYSAEEYDLFVKEEQERSFKSLANAEAVQYQAPIEPRMVVGTYENSVMGKAAVTLEDENMLCITVGPLGWKHELENVNGNDFLFESDGHIFKASFNLNKKGDKVESMSIDLGHGEDFGLWKKR